ncbi:MAG: hypothetical protein J7605_02555 [Variovorax sp.]|nr:hypothetical protein [Variovorax sp.]
MAAASKQGDIALVDAIVAPGRSVHVSTRTTQIWNGEKMVEGVRAGEAVGPGGTVSLPAPEVERLQELGFLVKPGAASLPIGNGPTFGTSEGPKVTEGT